MARAHQDFDYLPSHHCAAALCTPSIDRTALKELGFNLFSRDPKARLEPWVRPHPAPVKR